MPIFFYVYCGMVAVGAIVLSVIGRRNFHRIEAEAARNSFAGLGETLRSLRLDRESRNSDHPLFLAGHMSRVPDLVCQRRFGRGRRRNQTQTMRSDDKRRRE